MRLALTVQISFAGPALATFIALAMVEPHVEHERPHYLENLRRGFTFAWRTPQVRYTVLLGSTIMMAAFAPVVLVQPFLIEHDVATGLFGVFQAPLRLAAVVAAVMASIRATGDAAPITIRSVSCRDRSSSPSANSRLMPALSTWAR